MSIEKSELKMAVANDLGCRLDDTLEAVRKEAYRQEGAKAALQVAGKAIQDLVPLVDREMDEGLLSLEEASKVKRHLLRVVACFENLFKQSHNLQLLAAGKAQGLEAAVQVIKRQVEEEAVKLKAMTEPLPVAAEGESPLSLKQIRIASERIVAEVPDKPPTPVCEEVSTPLTTIEKAIRKVRQPIKGKPSKASKKVKASAPNTRQTSRRS